MRKKLLSILALAILMASTVVGCGEGSPCPSTLTILSITEGEVLVMKEGTEDWVPAEAQMELEVGDGVKTGGNSSAEIAFFDGSTMELGAGTEIEILSLDIVCNTGVTTITLAQMIGDTINRVTGILDPADPAFNEVRREQLQKLYEELCLAITVQKAGVCEELGRVRKGKKTIQTYRNHI